MKRFSLNWSLLVLALSLGMLSGQLSAATRGISITTAEGEDVTLYKNSYALLVGVADYTAGWPDLNSIHSELDDVENALEKQGFEVTRVKDPSSSQLFDAYRGFVADHGYDPENRLLFYFSGHGFTRDNGNKGYLVPHDAPNPEKDERGFLRKAYPMVDLIALARKVESTHALFLFDSCFSGTIFKTRALPKMPPTISRLTSRPVRQFITAGDAGEEVPAQSVFTPAFVEALEYGTGDLNKDGFMTGTELGMHLQNLVPQSVRQTPQFGKINDFELSRGDYVFAMATPSNLVTPTGPAATTATDATAGARNIPESRLDLANITGQPGVAQPPAQGVQWVAQLNAMQQDYQKILQFEADSDKTPAQKKQAWQQFLNQWGDDIPNTDEDKKLRDTAGQRVGPSSFSDRIADGSDGPEMVKLPPGSFEMGAVNGDGEPDEFPVRSVAISKPFALSRHEITFEEFLKSSKATGQRPPNDKRWGKGKRPVIQVSWKQAQQYVEWLSEQTGHRYRLPSEAEWEYAARAGSSSFFHFGNVASTEFANFDPSTSFNGSSSGHFFGKTQEVGTYPANGYDLHDMHGNVAEWVQDCYNESYDGAPSDQRAWESGNCSERVIRGGSYLISPKDMRSASRSKFSTSGRYSFVGFRVARDL